jgi:hypothetical protein
VLATIGGGEWSLDHAIFEYDLVGTPGLATAVVAGAGGAAALLAGFWRPEKKADDAAT